MTHIRVPSNEISFRKAIAEKKGISNAQLAIAWVSSLGSNVIPLPGSSNPGRVKENFAAGNIKFTEAELKAIRDAMESNKPQGGRYFGGATDEHLWS